MDARTCAVHPDRPSAWVLANGEGRCDPCQRPLVDLQRRHQREWREMDARHAVETAALVEALRIANGR